MGTPSTCNHLSLTSYEVYVQTTVARRATGSTSHKTRVLAINVNTTPPKHLQHTQSPMHTVNDCAEHTVYSTQELTDEQVHRQAGSTVHERHNQELQNPQHYRQHNTREHGQRKEWCHTLCLPHRRTVVPNDHPLPSPSPPKRSANTWMTEGYSRLSHPANQKRRPQGRHSTTAAPVFPAYRRRREAGSRILHTQ